MVKIRKNMVSSNIASKVTYGGTNTKTYLIYHETDNTNKGANADAHGRLQANGNSRQASWQYTVDDKEVVQSFSDNAQCWAAGNAHYNKHGINIEICVNSDGDFKKAVDNAIDLGKHLMKKHNIPLKNVINHNDTSGKNCPRNLLSGEKGITWSQFKAKLSDNTSSNTNTSTSNTKPQEMPKNKPNMTTKSIVVYLDSIGESSTYNHRKKLAAQYGINNYTGTAGQNTKLLSLLRGKGKPSNTTNKKPTNKGDMKTNSIVTYLNSVGTDSSYNNRAKLAKQHGISNYKGTAAQNTKLLKLLRGGSTASKPKQNIKQLADKIINSKNAPTGNEKRRKWLGVDKATYEKVRQEINRRFN